MYAKANEIRAQVLSAADDGRDCVGVCYGVPDLGERVIDDMPRVAMVRDANAAAEKVHQLLMRRHDADLRWLMGIGAVLQPDGSFAIEVRIDPRCWTSPEILFPEVPSSVDGFQVVFVRQGPAVALGGLGESDPDNDCAKIPPTWFRPSWVDNPKDSDRCPSGYEAIGLRCAGPCGGMWCRPVERSLRGFGQSSEQNLAPPQVQDAAFPLGPTVVIFALILSGFVLSFYVKRSPAGRWRLER
jgi:hypothetical protein